MATTAPQSHQVRGACGAPRRGRPARGRRAPGRRPSPLSWSPIQPPKVWVATGRTGARGRSRRRGPAGSQDGRHQDVLERVEEGLQRPEAGQALGEVAHAGREAGAEEEPGDAEPVEEAPEDQPVAPLEVGVRARPLLRAEGRQVGVGGRLRGRIAPPPRGRRRRRPEGLAPSRATASPGESEQDEPREDRPRDQLLIVALLSSLRTLYAAAATVSRAGLLFASGIRRRRGIDASAPGRQP